MMQKFFFLRLKTLFCSKIGGQMDIELKNVVKSIVSEV